MILTLSSTHSTIVSLDSIRRGKGGLDSRRKNLLDKVPEESKLISGMTGICIDFDYIG